MAYLKPALLLGAGGMLATLALSPYLIALMPQKLAALHHPLWLVLGAQALEAGMLCLLLGWIGLYLGAGYGLRAPWLQAWVDRHPTDPTTPRRWLLAAAIGTLSGVLVAALSLAGSPLGHIGAAVQLIDAAWRGALASFYGGIVEEVACRLLLISLFVWLLAQLNGRQARLWMFVTAILLAALLFGAGHLPAAFAIGMAHTPLMIGRIVLLNALFGLVTGTLFWKYGLEHAMLAHFCADLVLHVALPLASSI
jgi:vacuolar-type H+-ATPase subunit I/STV1